MSKIKRVKATDVSAALANTLTLYSEEIQRELYDITKSSMEDLVQKTKASAPVGPTGAFKKRITFSEVPLRRGVRFVWHVKAPDHRITHLIVHGHDKADGGRVDGNPFLQTALDTVVPQFEAEVERVLREGGADT